MSVTDISQPAFHAARAAAQRERMAAASGAKAGMGWLVRLLVAIGVWVAIVMVWYIACRVGILPASVFPTPRAVALALREELVTGRLKGDLIASLFRVTTGFLMAVALAVPSGLWLGNHALSRAACLPVVNFMRSLSPLAWIPFAIVWFGIGDKPSIFLIFLATVFPLTLATLSAVAGIPRTYLRVALDYGLEGVPLLTKVMLPAILPQVITALRVTWGLAWLVVVAAELIVGHDGLGFAIWDARNGLRMDFLVAEMLVIGALGVVIDWALFSLTKIGGVRWGYEQ